VIKVLTKFGKVIAFLCFEDDISFLEKSQFTVQLGITHELNMVRDDAIFMVVKSNRFDDFRYPTEPEEIMDELKAFIHLSGHFRPLSTNIFKVICTLTIIH